MLFNMNFKIMYMRIFSWLYKENITDAIFLYCKPSKQNKLSKNSVVVIYVCLIKIWASYQIRKIASCACAGNAGSVFPAPRVRDPDMHHGTCVTHVPWCMLGSLTSRLPWSRWWGKHSGACATRNLTYLVRGPYQFNIAWFQANTLQCKICSESTGSSISQGCFTGTGAI